MVSKKQSDKKVKKEVVQSPLPNNEIVKVFGSFRITKIYEYSYWDRNVSVDRFILEERRYSSLNEPYYVEASINPNRYGQTFEFTEAIRFIDLLESLNRRLVEELAK